MRAYNDTIYDTRDDTSREKNRLTLILWQQTQDTPKNEEIYNLFLVNILTLPHPPRRSQNFEEIHHDAFTNYNKNLKRPFHLCVQ